MQKNNFIFSFLAVSALVVMTAVSAVFLQRQSGGTAQVAPVSSRAVVLNYNGESVTVFDTVSNQVVNTVPVGSLPILTAMHGKYAYVLGLATDGTTRAVVSKIDIMSAAVVGTLMLPPISRPVEWEMSPNGEIIALADADHAKLYFLRARSLSIRATMALCDLCGTLISGGPSAVSSTTPPTPPVYFPSESVPVVNFSLDSKKLYAAVPVDQELVTIDIASDPPSIVKATRVYYGGGPQLSEQYRDLKRIDGDDRYYNLLISTPDRRGQTAALYDAVDGRFTSTFGVSDFGTDLEYGAKSTVRWAVAGSDDYEDGSQFDRPDEVTFYDYSAGRKFTSPASEAAQSFLQVGNEVWSFCPTRTINAEPEEQITLCDPPESNVYNSANFQLVTTITLPDQAHLYGQKLMAVSPGGKYVYIPLERNVLAYNASTKTVAARIPTDMTPVGVYIGGDTRPKELLVGFTGNIPNPPSDLTATAVSNTQIRLDWRDNSNDEYEFRIWRQRQDESVFSEIARTPRNSISYTDSGLPTRTRFCYYLPAINGYGRSLKSNTACATTPR